MNERLGKSAQLPGPRHSITAEALELVVSAGGGGACDRVTAPRDEPPTVLLSWLGGSLQARVGGAEHGWGAVQMRGGAARKGGVRGVGFIRLVTGTTYCIGHKSSFSPNLSFKQIIWGGGDASAILRLSRGLREGGGGMEEWAGEGGALTGNRDRPETDILSGQQWMEEEVTEGETVPFRTKAYGRFKGIVHANPTLLW